MTELRTSLIFIALLTACTNATQAKADGEAWMPLSPRSLTSQQWRSASPTSFASLSLDINGDGSPDHASLVVSSDLKWSGIRVCYENHQKAGKKGCSVIAVEENTAEVMGLEKKKPGCYAYIEDAYGTSSGGKKICSQNEVVEYFRFGSAGSFFIYDQSSNTFKRYWDSD